MKIGVNDTVAEFDYIEDTSSEGNGNFGQYIFKLSGNDGETTVSALNIAKTGISAPNLSGTNTGDQVSSDFTHDDLSGYVANEHIDWTTDQGSTNIHANNYNNTQLSNSQVVAAIVASTGISNSDKSTFRSNIGAGTSSFSGSYNDLSNKPTTISSPQAQKLAYISVTQAVNLDTIETNSSLGATAYTWGDHADAGYTSNTGDITQVSAGAGLTGGATSGNATLNLDVDGTNSYIHMNNTVTPTTGDFIPFHDTNGNVVRKTTISTLLGLGGTGSKSLSSSGNRYDVIPFVASDGVMEVGRYIDFHTSDGSTSDFAHRLTVNGSTLNFSAGIAGTSASFSNTVDMNSNARFNYSSGSRGSQFEAATTAVQTLRCDSDRFRFWLGSERLTITDTGRVGINDSTPDYTLDVSGNVSGISIYASHDIAAYSDKRVKKDIETIEDALQKVNKLRGVTFKRKDGKSDKVHMGVIAQEVQEVIPEVVTAKESDGHLSVSYGNMVGVLIEAVKELTAEVEELKSKLNDV